jgi:teichuronic acid biosynthesis glycosyltransferase TuaH
VIGSEPAVAVATTTAAPPSGLGARGADAAGAGLIVVCAANNYDTVKVADHHMAERLACLSHVLYVDPPLSRLSPRNKPELAPSLAGPRLRFVSGGFWRLTPVVGPGPLRPGMRPVTERLVRRALAHAVRRIGLPVRAVISAWPAIDVFGACSERIRVWWAQDDFAAGAGLMGHVAEQVAAAEQARLRRSDFVVAANPVIAARLGAAGHDVELIPYGSDPETFAAPPSPAGPTADAIPPVAALVGQLNERIAPHLLEAVADRAVPLLLVGPAAQSGSDWLRRLTDRPGVTWVGAQPFSALPALLSRAHVGLVPYADSAFNRGSFPLKTLEYLSAGLPVVATGLPATRWLSADADLITIADHPADFADAVVRAVSSPSTPELRDRCRAFARAHSYEQRAHDLIAAIDRRIAADAGS